MSDRGYHDRYDRYDRGGGGYRDHRSGGGGYRRDHDNQRGDDRRGSGGGGGQYRNRGGGGGNYDRQQRRGNRYQSSYIGQKRGRDEPEALDPKKQFILRLMRLGEPGQLSETDKTNAGDTAEKTLENALWSLKQEIKHQTPNLEDIVLEAVVSCSHKTVHYAVLLGLLHSENPDWVSSFVTVAGQRFASELAAGEVDGPRVLLRLFSCLTLTSVLHPADVLGLMERLLEVAQAHAAAGQDPTGLTWQPWTDQLVYAVMGALVWGGLGLATAAESEHSQVLEAISAYMAARPLQEYVDLRPMFGASDVADSAAASDSGGASFLGRLWDALQELRDPEGGNWQVEGVPHQLINAFSAKIKGAPVELPPLDLPQQPPAPATAADAQKDALVARAETAVSLQDRYPARGGMSILERQYTDAKRPAVERFVAEEYIIDLLGAFDSHRVELAQMLCSSLPLPYDYSGLLCETLFAQLLRLPTPRLSPVAFSALIAHAALLRPGFPKYLAGSVRQLYLRLQFLAPELSLRLADVLAHFITNMNFRWPWDKYRSGLAQPPGGPQRSFLVLVLQHLVRLTSWDHQELLQETPPEFLALLGEQPKFVGLPVPALSLDQVQQWMADQQMSEQLGSPEQQLRAVCLAVLAAGSKSCSHCYVLLERFAPLLHHMLAEVEVATGEQLVLEVLGQAYGQVATRLDLALARLNELNLISPVASVAWLVASPMLQLGPAVNEAAAADAWQLINAVLDNTFARYDGAIEDRAQLAAAVEKAEARLRAASEESAAAAEAQQRADQAAAEGEEQQDGRGAGGRQAIVWPAGGSGSRQGASRMELAIKREELMANKLSEAEAAAADHEEVVGRLHGARGDALITAFKVLCDRLADAVAKITLQAKQQPLQDGAEHKSGTEQEEEVEDEEQQGQQPQQEDRAAADAESARQLCLAQARGFACSQRSRLVQLGLTNQLLQYVEEQQLDDDLKAALLGPLHLI
eukprot:gene13002-13131_t